MILLSGDEDFFNNLAQLIYFDRENAAITALITEFGDRSFKSAVNGFNPMTEQILEPDNDRERKTAGPRFTHHFHDVDRSAAILHRSDLNVAVAVNREIIAAPAIHIVSGDGGLDIPVSLHWCFIAGVENARPTFSFSARNMQVTSHRIHLSYSQACGLRKLGW